MGGSVDLILSDWLWVARERGLGSESDLPALFDGARRGHGSGQFADQTARRPRGKTLGVAGGPLDKSWLLLRAYAHAAASISNRDANVVFGAPPLLYQKALAGELAASLNFWNFAVPLEARGFRRLIGVEEVEKQLGAKGPLAIVGYVFDENLAKTHGEALKRFFEIARQAKTELSQSDADWARIGRELGVTDPKELALYRKAYTDGIPARPVAAEAADAAALYHVLRDIGGPELVGAATELDPGVF